MASDVRACHETKIDLFFLDRHHARSNRRVKIPLIMRSM